MKMKRGVERFPTETGREFLSELHRRLKKRSGEVDRPIALLFHLLSLAQNDEVGWWVLNVRDQGRETRLSSMHKALRQTDVFTEVNSGHLDAAVYTAWSLHSGDDNVAEALWQATETALSQAKKLVKRGSR